VKDIKVKVPERNRSLSTLVHEALEAMVLEGTLAPGSRINMDALAREMDVSQTPLRESLVRLESLGLVALIPQRGYFVAPMLTGAEFESLFDFRMRMEPWCASQAAMRASEEDRRWLTEEIESAGHDIEASSDWSEYVRVAAHDARFHERIAEIAGNRWAADALKKSNVHLHLLRLYFIGRMGTHAVREHAPIAEAIISGEPEKASRLMEEHLESSRRRLGKVN
jgi:DNA-binding GntR family transcriptional regulator